MEVIDTPLKRTRQLLGEAAASASDEELIVNFATAAGLSPDTPLDEIINLMEQRAEQKISAINANSSLKASRRLLGESSFGLEDTDLALQFAEARGIPDDTPLDEVFKIMEESARRGLFEENRQLFTAEEGVNVARELSKILVEQAGAKPVFGSEDPLREVNFDNVKKTIDPRSRAETFFEEAIELPFDALFEVRNLSKRAGRFLNRILTDDPKLREKVGKFNEIENFFSDPDRINAFAAEATRFLQNPELFTEEERQNLINAARAFQTTSNAFDVETTPVADFFTSAAEALTVPVIRAVNEVSGSVAKAAGFDRKFFDNILRDIDFAANIARDADEDSLAKVAGSITGSTLQTMLLIATGVGPAAIGSIYGTIGAGEGIQRFREFAARDGIESKPLEELITGLGAAVITGGLASVATGRLVETAPGLRKLIEGGEQAIFKLATAPSVSGVSKDALFRTGLQAINAVFKNPQALKESFKNYARFAVSSGIVEGTEEAAEVVANEAFFNAMTKFTRDKYDFNPDEFFRNVALEGIGGLVGGIGIGPTIRKRIRTDVLNSSRNFLGLENIAVGSAREAEAKIAELNKRAEIFSQRFPDQELPGVVIQELNDALTKLDGIAKGVVDPEEVFDLEEINRNAKVLGPGDILTTPELKASSIASVAEEALTREPETVTENQKKAFDRFISFFEKSDLPVEAVNAIASRAFKSRLPSLGGKRNSLTVTLVNPETREKVLSRVLFTNASSEESALDEVFHVVNDSRPDAEQKALVEGYNKIFNTGFTSYDQQVARDRIAKTFSEIASGKRSLPEGVDQDNEFVRTVRLLLENRVSEVNPRLSQVSEADRLADLVSTSIPAEKFEKGISSGRIRRVQFDDPSVIAPTYQDEGGIVFTVENVDVGGDGQRVLKITPLARTEPLPTVIGEERQLVAPQPAPPRGRPIPEGLQFPGFTPRFVQDRQGRTVRVFIHDESGRVFRPFTLRGTRGEEAVLQEVSDETLFTRPDIPIEQQTDIPVAVQIVSDEEGNVTPIDEGEALDTFGMTATRIISPQGVAARLFIPESVTDNERKSLIISRAARLIPSIEDVDPETVLFKQEDIERRIRDIEKVSTWQKISPGFYRLDHFGRVFTATKEDKVWRLSLSGKRTNVNAGESFSSFKELREALTNALLEEFNGGAAVSEIETVRPTEAEVRPQPLFNERVFNSVTEEQAKKAVVDAVDPEGNAEDVTIFKIDDGVNEVVAKNKTALLRKFRESRPEEDIVPKRPTAKTKSVRVGDQTFDIEEDTVNIRDIALEEDERTGRLLSSLPDGELLTQLKEAVREFWTQQLYERTGDERFDAEAAGDARNRIDEIVRRAEEGDTQGLDTEQTEQEIPINLEAQQIRETIRGMRRAVKRDALVRNGANGNFAFFTKKFRSVDVFKEKAEELGARNLRVSEIEVEPGKRGFAVLGRFHPAVAREVFQDEDFILEEMAREPGTLFPDRSATVGITDRPILTFSSNVPENIKDFVKTAVKKLKIPGRITFVLGSDIDHDMLTSLNSQTARAMISISNSFFNPQKQRLGVAAFNLGPDTDTIVAINDILGIPLDSLQVKTAIAHELGHVFHRFVLQQNPEADTKLQERHRQIVEEAMQNNWTVSEFVAETFPAALAEFFLASGGPNNLFNVVTLPTLKHFNPDGFGYVTRYSEWVANQTARFILENLSESDQTIKRFFQTEKETLESIYEQYRITNNLPEGEFAKFVEEWISSAWRQDALNSRPIQKEVAGSEEEELAVPVSLIDPFNAEVIDGNQEEHGIAGEILNLRDEIKEWREVEAAVLRGDSISERFDGEKRRKVLLYESLFRTALSLRDRPAEVDDHLGIMFSYASSGSLFPQVLQDRLDEFITKFRNSFLNDLRRRAFTPIAVRMQTLANDHPDIPLLGLIIDKTIPVPGRATSEVTYTEAILSEITTRTQRLSEALDPIYAAFGYTNSTLQRLVVGTVKGGKIVKTLEKLAVGIRDKSLLKQEELDEEFNGVRFEEVIDRVRAEMDSLRNYAVERGILDPDDFIVFEDEGEHYYPRVYNREVIAQHFDFFKDKIIKRNLERVYKQTKFAESEERRLGRELTEEEIDALEVPESFELTDQDRENIENIATAIATKILYGRSVTLEGNFNPDFVGPRTFSNIVETVANNPPPRLRRRTLNFVPDAELLGAKEVDGFKINFLEPNVMDVLARSIETIVKRGEFARAYGKRGELFAQADEALRQKMLNTVDPVAVEKLRRDRDTLRGFYESIAEVVDLSRPGTRRFVEAAPVRKVIHATSRIAAFSVMTLSAILAVVETGTMPVRAGLYPGLLGMFKTFSVMLKKMARWPGAIVGMNERYTDIMERELIELGYLHDVMADVASRVRFDIDNLEEGSFGRIAGPLNRASLYAEDVFFRINMLEQITRASQIGASYAANSMIRAMSETFRRGTLNAAQLREVKRLGFVKENGEADLDAFKEYIEFFDRLDEARSQGEDALFEFARDNEKMFRTTHFRVMNRLITQMITRPNVATRTVWGNSNNPILRAMYRLRGFTHGYRTFHASFYLNEVRDLVREGDGWGILKFLARFLPILVLGGIATSTQAELKATLMDYFGARDNAERIREAQRDMNVAEFLISSIDRAGLLIQAGEITGGLRGMQFGNSVFAAFGGVVAAKVERFFSGVARTAQTGDPAYIWNSTIDVIGTNLNAFEKLRLKSQLEQERAASDLAFHKAAGFARGENASWWKSLN